jgi:hypothetical protein
MNIESIEPAIWLDTGNIQLLYHGGKIERVSFLTIDNNKFGKIVDLRTKGKYENTLAPLINMLAGDRG